MPRGNFDNKEVERALVVALVLELLMCTTLRLWKSLSKIDFAAIVCVHKQICNAVQAGAAAERKGECAVICGRHA